jgi:hypothetical protein
MVFADLLLSRNDTANQETLAFIEAALMNYNNVSNAKLEKEPLFNGTDLMVVLGNAVNGSDWDG